MALRRPKALRRAEAALVPAAMTAATAVVDLGSASSWKTWKFGNRDWQTEAWRLYDIIPEHRFLCGRIGDSVSQARLYVAELDETGEESGEVEDVRIQRLAAVPLGTGTQRDENLRLAGVDLAAAGECWIVGEGAAGNPLAAEGSWFVVTGAAIDRRGGRITVRRPQQRGGSRLELTDGRDILTRCWRSHPNDVDQADSATRAAIPVLRELELLTKREFAELDSRLTGAGLMFVPESAEFPRGPDDPNDLHGFMAYMQRTAAASMANHGDARSMVPIMARIPDHLMQFVDAMKPITFWSELSEAIAPMKDATIRRLANSFELPNEVLTGLSDGNHWTAWLISEEGIRWIRGYLGLIADALTRGFLRPALEAMGVANPERYAFAFDTSPLAARPNRLEEALQLHDRNLLSDVEVVRAGAFDDKQMPTADERLRLEMWALVKTQPDLILDPAVQRVLGFPDVESVGLPPAADQNADSGDPGGRNAPPNRGAAPALPAADENAGQARALTAALDRRIERALTAAPSWPVAAGGGSAFQAACKLTVFRAMELAGGRMTNPQERRQRWADVPRHQLNARIGPVTPDRAERMLEGAWTHITEVATDMSVDPGELQRLLHGYCMELLTRGLPHSDDLLFAALSVARRGEGLVPA